jgi:hypothetical protein
MLLLFSWQRRAWKKERCSRDCFYNGTAATAVPGYLTGLTRLTDTSAAANIWRDSWRKKKKAVLSPSAAAAPAIQIQMQCNCGGGICVFVYSLLLLLQDKLAQHKKKKNYLCLEPK